MSKTTPPLARYTEKEPTELQTRFTAWIEEKTGYKPDAKSVALSVALRMEFQRSEENQTVLKAARDRSAEAKAAKTVTPKKSAAKPSAPAKRRRAAKEEAPAAAPEDDAVLAEPGDELVNGEIVKDADPRPEPMFEDEAADKAVEDSQKVEEPKPAPKRRRSTKTVLQG